MAVVCAATTRGAAGDSGAAHGAAGVTVAVRGQQVSIWPRVAQQASSRPHGAQIPEGLLVRAEERQVARSPGEPLGRAGRPPWW
jgi:hypothetical protein